MTRIWPRSLRRLTYANLLRYSWQGLMVNQFKAHPEAELGTNRGLRACRTCRALRAVRGRLTSLSVAALSDAHVAGCAWHCVVGPTGGNPILEYYNLANLNMWTELAILVAFFAGWCFLAWFALAFVRHQKR